MAISSYKDLIVWQKAMKLVALVYVLTKDFPKEEIYGIVSQIRRAVVSIPSNIAEGWTRKNTVEFINFLSIANGSVAELETQLIISEELNYGNKKLYSEIYSLLIEVQKLIPAVINGLRRTNPSPLAPNRL